MGIMDSLISQEFYFAYIKLLNFLLSNLPLNNYNIPGSVEFVNIRMCSAIQFIGCHRIVLGNTF